MKIYKDIIQGSPEWHVLRELRFTASEADTIAVNGKGMESLVIHKMASYYSTAEKEYYSNKDIERGKELEPIAAEMYELQEGAKLEKVGFVEVDEYTGCSPDRLIGEDGLWECKAVNDVNHYKLIVGGESAIDSSYIWQCQMQMLLTGRKYDMLCFYNPNFQKSMLIFRIEPDEEKQKALQVGLEKGIELLKKHLLLNK